MPLNPTNSELERFDIRYLVVAIKKEHLEKLILEKMMNAQINLEKKVRLLIHILLS